MTRDLVCINQTDIGIYFGNELNKETVRSGTICFVAANPAEEEGSGMLGVQSSLTWLVAWCGTGNCY
jgi:hypothetical protein